MKALNNASAFFRQHRTAVLAAGGAGVVGVAMITRSRKNAAATAGVVPGSSADTSSQIGQPADPYSTVAYDVYDALQPQLEQSTGQLQTEIDQLRKSKADRTKKKPTKKAAPPVHKRKVPPKSPKKPIKRKRHAHSPAQHSPPHPPPPIRRP